ncbi:MAG: O-antigen ligase family protein [Anaerolineae bacterium]|nr:O-antigen ligase family protein [Anaerolineae bacterium]
MTLSVQSDVWRVWAWGAVVLVCGLAVALLPAAVAGVLVGGVAAVLAITIRPIIGLAIALFVGPFGAWEAVFVGGVFGRFSSGQIVFFLALAAWLIQMLADRELHIPRTTFNLPLLLFITVMALTLWQTTSTWDGLKEIGKWVEITLIMWLVIASGERLVEKKGDSAETRLEKTEFLTRTRFLRFLVLILLLGAVLQALLGIWQYALRGDGPEHFLISEGLYRASGTFQQPNPYGGYISMMLTVASGAALGMLIALWHQWQHKQDLRRIDAVTWLWLSFLVVAVCLLLGALLSSWSRGAWINFAAGMVVLAFFLPRKRRYGVLLVLAGGFAFVAAWQLDIIPASIWARLTGFLGDLQLADVRGVDINDANFAVIERLAHWQTALGMAREELWLGVGFGNYEAVYSQFALVNWPLALGHAHNYYLNLLAETGIVGLLAYIGLWLVIVWQTVRLLALRSWEARGIALGLLGAWVGMAVHHFLDNLYVNNLYLQLGTMLGIVIVLQRLMQAEPSKRT